MLNTYLTDTATLLTPSQDKHGEKTTTATVTKRCRVEWKQKLIRDRAGREVMAAAKVMFGPDDQIDPGQQMTLSGGGSRVYVAESVEQLRDFSARGWEVYVV